MHTTTSSRQSLLGAQDYQSHRSWSGANWEKATLAEIKKQEIVDLMTTHNFIREGFLLEKMAKNPTESPSVVVFRGARDVDSIVIEDSDHTTFVERLRLSVITHTTEIVTTTTVGSGTSSQRIKRNTIAVWRFESLVTTPDDIDWRILTFMEQATGSTQL